MPLDIKAEIANVRKYYEEEGKQDLIRVLLTGESGTGKTFMASTAPKPIHIDSFDPTGTLSIRHWINKGDIIADVQYEDEDPFNPTVFKAWKATFEQRLKGGYFNSIATYWLDSATTWTDAIMNYTQGSSRAGKVPEWKSDYHPQKVTIRNYLRKIMKLPCHFILTAHIEPQKNREGSIIARRVMFSGKGAITIPLLFTEIWVTDVKETSKDNIYRVLLQKKGLLLGRSRLASKSVLDTYEPANLKYILKKSGMNYEDKELL